MKPRRRDARGRSAALPSPSSPRQTAKTAECGCTPHYLRAITTAGAISAFLLSFQFVHVSGVALVLPRRLRPRAAFAFLRRQRAGRLPRITLDRLAALALLLDGLLRFLAITTRTLVIAFALHLVAAHRRFLLLNVAFHQSPDLAGPIRCRINLPASGGFQRRGRLASSIWSPPEGPFQWDWRCPSAPHARDRRCPRPAKAG